MALGNDQLYAHRCTPITPDYPTCRELQMTWTLHGPALAISQFCKTFRNETPDVSFRLVEVLDNSDMSWCFVSLKQSTQSLDLRDHIDHFCNQFPIESCKAFGVHEDSVESKLHCKWVSEFGMGGPTLWPEQMSGLCVRGSDLEIEFHFTGNIWLQDLPLLANVTSDRNVALEIGCERTYAELRIYPVDYGIPEITKIVGANPTTALAKGEKRYLDKVYSRNVWSLSSENSVSSNVLDEHLSWLLPQIAIDNSQKTLLSNDKELRLTVFCVWWSQAKRGGLRISTKNMGLLAASELELTIDAQYFGD